MIASSQKVIFGYENAGTRWIIRRLKSNS